MSDAAIRLSDAERDAAAADLGEHFAQGRLSADEHDERLGAVWSAKTRGEIAPIFRDLPSPYAGVAQPTPRAPSRAVGYWNAGPRAWHGRVPTPLFVVLVVLVVATVLVHLPLFLLGFGVYWFVVARHRGPHRHHGPHGYRRHPGWR